MGQTIFIQSTPALLVRSQVMSDAPAFLPGNLRFIGLFCRSASGIHFLSHSDGGPGAAFL
jgi:hypothetical protein